MPSSPVSELDPRYGDPDVAATSWNRTEGVLAGAGVSWITTLRADGRPHTTPLITVWTDGALHFCTGPEEQKARNLGADRRVSFTTGCNDLHGGTDVVLEGEAVRVTDAAALVRLAAAWEAKYGEEWHFDVADGMFRHGAGRAAVYRVAPRTVYAFGKDPYSHTRFRFGG